MTLRDCPIDIDTFISTFEGVQTLTHIRCPFSSSSSLAADEIDLKLQKAFPNYRPTVTSPSTQPRVLGQMHNDTLPLASSSSSLPPSKVLSELNRDTSIDVEMGVLEPNAGFKKSGTVSRTAIVERKKEELKTAEVAKKEKGRISATIRKLRSAARGGF